MDLKEYANPEGQIGFYRNDADKVALETLIKAICQKFQKFNFKCEEEKDINPDYYYPELINLNVENIPMTLKKHERTGMKFDLKQIKEENPAMFEYMFDLFQRTSGPEFNTVKDVVDYFNKNLFEYYTNPKTKNVAKATGIFESSAANHKIIEIYRKHKYNSIKNFFNEIEKFFISNGYKFKLLKKHFTFQINDIPFEFVEDEGFCIDEENMTENMYDYFQNIDEDFSDKNFTTLEALVKYLKKFPLYQSKKLIKANDKIGVFEKIKSFKDFNK